MSQTYGWSLLIVFFALMVVATIYVGRQRGKEAFLVADRDIGWIKGGTSVAASWIWAPALFLAAQKSYLEGWVGLFWFVVPNILCLIIFSEFAHRLRDRMPMGYTLSGYMRHKFNSARLQGVYAFELIALAICSFAVQLLAGGLIFSTLTGIPYAAVIIFMALSALSYSLFSGIRASIITDHIQLIIILLVSFAIVPWVVYSSGGWSVVTAGLGGFSGEYTSLFSGKGGSVFFSFGLAVTIGLIAGPFGDQSFWQRSMAIRKGSVRKAFILGAILFGIVPLTISILGFVAAGSGLVAAKPQLVNLETVLAFLPAWVALPFAFMLVCGLVSTLDSCLCAVSSIAGSDLADITGSKDVTKYARWGMTLTAVGGVAIAAIPAMQILYLFLFYGTLRASVLLPTVITLMKKQVSEPAMFYGIITAITIGLPIFAYGNFNKIPLWIVVGSLLTVLSSGIITLIGSRK